MMKPFRTFIQENALNPGLLKCVFLAGGPGSGKSTLAADVFGLATHREKTFSMLGMTITSSDMVYERMMHERGINPHDLASIEANNPDEWRFLNDTLRGRAKMEINQQRAALLDKRAGIIFDGTGEDYDEKVTQKADVEHHGYDAYMIFVQTPLALSLSRNKERDRILPDDVVVSIWMNAEANRPRFRELFGENFHEVDDSSTLKDDTRHLFMKLIREPVQNEKGRVWLEAMGLKG